MVLSFVTERLHMTDNPRPRRDVLLTLAYWSTLALALLGLALSLLWLALMLQPTATDGPGWRAGLPVATAVVAWLYLDVLSLAYWRPTEQRPLVWLILVCGVGAVTLVILARGAFVPDDSVRVFGLRFAIGCLAFAAVCRMTLARLPRPSCPKSAR
jgi:hypothetical protein